MPNQFYRTPDPYERVNINQLARINQNDPWFGLGYALAQGWNRAYNQRGVEKSVDELEKSLGPTEQERSNARGAVLSTQPTVEDDYNQLNQYLDDTLKNGGGYVANPATANAFNNAQAPEGSLFAAAQNWSNSGNSQPMYSYGVGDARAYETGNVQAIDALANAQAADRLRNFDIDSWQAQQRANLVKQGRSPEQIEAAMAVMMPQAQALDKRNKELDTQEAINMLAGVDLSKGFNPKILDVAGRLTESNPELSRMLYHWAVSPRDEYSANAQLKAQDNSFDNSVKLAEAKEKIKQQSLNLTVEELRKLGWNDNQIAAYVYGGRGKSGAAGANLDGIGSKKFEYANETIASLLEKQEMSGLTPEETQQLAALTKYKDSVVAQTYGFGGGNYSGNDLKAALDNGLAQGGTPQQLLDEMLSKGFTVNDPEYQQAAWYLGVTNNQPQQAPAQQPAQQQPAQQQEQPAQQEDSGFDWAWINPKSPLLQPDASGNPTWLPILEQQGLTGLAEVISRMNQGENGLPYFWTQK